MIPLPTIGRLLGALVIVSLVLAFIGMNDADAGPGMIWPTHGWPMEARPAWGLTKRLWRIWMWIWAPANRGLSIVSRSFAAARKFSSVSTPHDYASVYGKEAKTKDRSMRG